MRQLFLVSVRHGGPWDWSRGLRDQEGFGEHGAFMDALVDDGFVVLGGPLDERDVLLVVASDSEDSIRARLGPDPWIENGMLSITSIRPWTILLQGPLGEPASMSHPETTPRATLR